MTKTLTAAGFICSTPDAIFGVGETAEAAEANAREWAQDGDLTGFKTMPSTAALIAKVEVEGGAISWDDSGSIACTREEADEE